MIAHVSTAASFDLIYSHVLLNVRGKIWRKKKKTSAGDFIIEWTSPNIATQIKKPTIFLGCIVLWDHCQWLAQTSLYNAPLYSRKKEMIFLNEIRDCVNVEVGNWQTARRIWRSGGQNNEEKKRLCKQAGGYPNREMKWGLLGRQKRATATQYSDIYHLFCLPDFLRAQLLKGRSWKLSER